jgi:hypothetical protein
MPFTVGLVLTTASSLPARFSKDAKSGRIEKKDSHLNQIFLLKKAGSISPTSHQAPLKMFFSLVLFNFLSYYNYWLLLLKTTMTAVLAKHSYIAYVYYILTYSFPSFINFMLISQ